MFAIAWQYLTGRCVATDFADRQAAEWPPHPDRFFQALVAAWGERGEEPGEREALEWLEALPNPRLVATDIENRPAPIKVFVPVNDNNDQGRNENKKWKPFTFIRDIGLGRNRQSRSFPYTRVGDDVCMLIWPEADPGEHRAALAHLCAEVIRIGHSSSLVRCWIEAQPPAHNWEPTAANGRRKDASFRVAETGRLATLIGHRKSCENLNPPRYVGTPTARQVPYVRVGTDKNKEAPQGIFTAPLVIFRQTGGRTFSLRQTLDLTAALRKTLIAPAGKVSEQAKALVSGHAADGARLQVPHLAYLPLAFVGHQHADGHVLGMALVFPKGMKGEDEDAIWKSLAEASSEDGTIRLVLGNRGEMLLQVDDSGEKAPQALLSHTWCRASKTWASVTPLVLDRMQHSRRSDPDGWAAGQIGDMCERQGLPRPAQVLIRQPVSFHLGAPTVREFQALKRKDGSSHRMVHAHLTFKDAVAGPLILGAGRYKGYGLCKPIGAFEEPVC